MRKATLVSLAAAAELSSLNSGYESFEQFFGRNCFGFFFLFARHAGWGEKICKYFFQEIRDDLAIAIAIAAVHSEPSERASFLIRLPIIIYYLFRIRNAKAKGKKHSEMQKKERKNIEKKSYANCRTSQS